MYNRTKYSVAENRLPCKKVQNNTYVKTDDNIN